MLRWPFIGTAVLPPGARGFHSNLHTGATAGSGLRAPSFLEAFTFLGTAVFFTQTCLKRWEAQSAVSAKMAQEAQSVPVWNPSRAPSRRPGFPLPSESVSARRIKSSVMSTLSVGGSKR